MRNYASKKLQTDEKIKLNREASLKQTKDHYQKLAFKPKTSVTIAEIDAQVSYNQVYEERKKFEELKERGR